MKSIINPGKNRLTSFFFDHNVFSHVKDLDGKPLDLEISIFTHLTGDELAIARGQNVPEERPDLTGESASSGRPAIIWFQGNGWRGGDKHFQIGDMAFLAEAGYAICFADYRTSAQGHFPAQIIDAKTAVRYIRKHAAQYSINPNKIAVMGRSAGGHISATLGLNDDRYISEEWSDVSSNVQAVWDLFGPVDIYNFTLEHIEEFKSGVETVATKRWASMEETHEGALLGVSVAEMPEKAKDASPIRFVHDHMPPFLIMHGTADPLVPHKQSEDLYEKIIAAGKNNYADLYLLEGAGHGTPEFFQPSVQKIAFEFFEKHLKNK